MIQYGHKEFKFQIFNKKLRQQFNRLEGNFHFVTCFKQLKM